MAKTKCPKIRLGMLREKYIVKQSVVKNFTQTTALRLENHKDIRISTLINYLDSFGMELEIPAYPNNYAKKDLLLCV